MYEFCYTSRGCICSGLGVRTRVFPFLYFGRSIRSWCLSIVPFAALLLLCVIYGRGEGVCDLIFLALLNGKKRYPFADVV